MVWRCAHLFCNSSANLRLKPHGHAVTVVKKYLFPNNESTATGCSDLFFWPVCSQMVVQWTTADTGTPVVMYGESASAMTSTVQEMTKTYTASDMCGEPANTTGYIDPGMLHYATLSNLSYSTRYFYQYGDKVRDFYQYGATLLSLLYGATLLSIWCDIIINMVRHFYHYGDKVRHFLDTDGKPF